MIKKSLHKLNRLLLVFALLWSFSASAQQVVIGSTSGTSDYYYGPYYRSSSSSTFNWSNYAYIYEASELNIPTGSMITEIGWLRQNANTITGNNVFEIWMENSSSATLTNNTNWGTVIANATPVYNSTTQSFSGTAGTYETFVLSAPFIYTGGSLIISTRHVKNGTANGAINFYVNSASGKSIGTASSSALTNASNLSTTYGNSRPTVQISYAPAIPCSGTPTAGAVSGPASVCPNTPFTVSHTGYTLGTGISFQWEESPAGANLWTPITGATNASLSLASGISAPTDFRVIVTCNNGGQTDASQEVSVTLNNFLNCYCLPTYSSGGSNDHITNVKLETLTNSSTGNASPYYRDYTQQQPATINIPDLMQGMNYTLELTFGADGTQFSGAWIDFDQNGVFDASEFFTAGTSVGGNGTITISIPVPASAATGITRMRVRGGDDSQPTAGQACGASSSSYGEAEDYLINILASNQCSNIPVAGTASGPSNICAGEDFTLSISGQTLALGITYQWEESPAGANMWTAIAGATSPTYTVTGGISSPTDYRAVVTCSNGGQSDITNQVNVSINPVTSCYCIPTYTYNCGGGDNIDDFILQGDIAPGINNLNTPCPTGGYADFTSMSAALSAGSTYSGNVTTSYTYPNEDVRIWIDYNADGVFDGSEEIATLDDLDNLATGAFTFTVPASATAGSYRMRVRLVYGQSAASIDPCINYNYGETHDYTVDITVPVPCAGTPVAGTATGPSAVCANEDIVLNLSGQTLASGITYQWESSPAGANTWTAIPGATTPSFTITGGQTSATDYRMVVTCANGGLTDESNVVAVNMSNFYGCYCSSTAQYAGDGEIHEVSFGSMTNASTCSSSNEMYTDYKSTVPAPQVMQTATVPFSVSAASCGGSYSGGLKIFIDYNRNGVFTDAGEEVFFQGGFTYTPAGTIISGNITIPLTADTGITGMRVIMQEGGTASNINPCGTFGYGETEDYLIHIMEAVGCTGSPVAGTASGPANICAGDPFTVTLTGYTLGAGITIEWFESPAGANMWTSIPGATTSTLNIASQSSSTDYQALVTCTNGGLTDYSNIVTVTQNAPGACYCTPTYIDGCAYGDDIRDFILSGDLAPGISNMNTTCVASSYQDFTAMSATLSAGLTYSGNVTTNYTSAAEDVRIWIDYGGDGFFDPSDEIATLDNLNDMSSGLFTFTVPASTTPGIYTLRVRLVWGMSSASTIDPCLEYDYGETHDYSVNIVPPPSCLPPTNLVTTGMLSNGGPISWTASTSNPGNGYEWSVFPLGSGPYGTPVASGSVPAGTSDNVSGLSPATDYTLYMRSVCSATDTSNWVSTNFATACAVIVGQYTQSFDLNTTPNCWSNTGPEQWLFSNGAGPGYGVTGSTDHTGNSGYFAWVDGSGTGTNQDITLESVPVDISGFAQPTLSYYMKSYNVDDNANNKLVVEVLDGSTWVQVDSVQWNFASNAWYNRQASLSGITATTIQVRFVVDESNAGGLAYYNDILIDDVQILSGPLAVGLVDIKADNIGDRNQIVWVTDNDDLGDVFEVERSTDSRNFEYLGTVQATGSGGTYTFWDEQPVKGTNYYRLRMRDVKGSYEYSRVVSATLSAGNRVSVYPNPATEFVTVEVPEISGTAMLTIADVTGKTIKVLEIKTQKTRVDLNGLADGVYLIQYQDGSRSEGFKINKH